MTEKRNIAQNLAEDEVLQWVTFQLENETYGINVMQVQEVLRYTEIAPVPGAPDYVLGIINLRGNVVTVIDTRSRFGLPAGDVSENSRIVIIEAEKQVIGIMVDSVAEVVLSALLRDRCRPGGGHRGERQVHPGRQQP